MFISPLVLDEALYVFNYLLSRKYKAKVRVKKLKEILESLLSLPNLQIINPPLSKKKQLKVIDFIGSFSLYPRDSYYLLTMLDNRINYLVSFDKDFKKVEKSGIVVVNE